MKNKKFIVLIFISVALSMAFLGCQSSPEAHGTDETAIDALMDAWGTGLIEEDIDLMMSAYAEDAVIIVINPEGSDRYEGKDVIREIQRAGMESSDFSMFTVSRTGDDTPSDAYTRVYIVDLPGVVSLLNSFAYDRIDSRWYIVEQAIEVAPVE